MKILPDTELFKRGDILQLSHDTHEHINKMLNKLKSVMPVPCLKPRKIHQHGLGVICYIVPHNFDLLENNRN